MATAAQIEANRLNAQKSTGPKSNDGKIRVRCNAIKHGMTARTIMPVLPQEDPKELEERTQQAITAMQPRNPLELELVRRAVQLSAEIECAERVGTAHLAHRVRMATRSGPETASALELKQVHELGSTLFFQLGFGPGYRDWRADELPAVIVRRLEESAEGCRWLLARWGELLNALGHLGAWNDPEIVRIVGLMGKRGIEAHFDRELNSLFHAFDALGNRMGQKFWQERRDRLPLGFIGGFDYVPYRAIAPPPRDATAAMALIRSVIDENVGRLQELLAAHEAIAAAEAAERHDRAALDCSREFERHRRYQSARTRELLRTLETLRKMSKEEFGTGNGEAETADGICQMADDECQVESGGCDQEPSSEPVTEGSRGSVVGCDSDRVMNDTTNDTNGILAHEEADAADKPCHGDCVRQSLPCGENTPQKAQNKANPESTQGSLPLTVKPSETESASRKQSQSAAADAVYHDMGDDPFNTITPADGGRATAQRIEQGEEFRIGQSQTQPPLRVGSGNGPDRHRSPS